MERIGAFNHLMRKLRVISMSKSLETDVTNSLDRRDFLKYCSAVAALLGLGSAQAKTVANALTSGSRPPVLWLHFAECTGCSESFLRANKPSVDTILLETLSLDYHETLLAGAGQDVLDTLEAAADKYMGEFFCVVEGAIPTADNGVYGMIGGKTMLSIAENICPKAKAIIAFGNCSSFGGIAAAAPNPTGAKGVREALDIKRQPVVKIPGCAPNPINLVGTFVEYLLKGELPELDDYGRPLFAYRETIHHICPYEDHTPEAEERCMSDEGCKGRKCKNNCSDVLFNDESFPMQVGHPCIACSEPEFWDKMTPFYERSESGGGREPYEFDPKWVIDQSSPNRRPLHKNDIGRQDERHTFNLRGQRIRKPQSPFRFNVSHPAK